MMKFIFVLCCVATFSISNFGQNLEADLRKSFNRFSLVKINNQEALRKAKSGIPFVIRTNEKNFQFILTPNDIRSADYRAEYTDANGRHELPREEVFTYKATLIGERNSLVALTVNGTTTEGYLATEREGFFMESARKYSTHADNDDKIIYQVRDKVKRDDFVCSLDESIELGMERINSRADFTTYSSTQTGRRILEVGIEAEKDFVFNYGSIAAANTQILSVMNQVNVVYKAQLNLKIVLTFQHFWMPGASDPYAGANDLIATFNTYWNNNFPASNPAYHRDVAYMFSLRPNATYSGIAYLATVCRQSFSAYSLGTTTRFDMWIVVAHEIGHTLDARHVDGIESCANTIMLGLVYPYGATEFCAVSINEITAHVNNYSTCLQLEPNITTRTLSDFDADGYADIGVFRPSDATWYIQQSSEGFVAYGFGLATDKLAPADYDGDGKTDIAVFRNGTWYIQRSSQGFLGIGFGTSADVPIPSDFTGDGKAELVVFRPSNATWYTYDLTNNQTGGMQLGSVGDKSLLGDFDGDDKSDYAVFRSSTGEWLIQRSTQGFYTLTFGYGSDLPTPADFDGDGKTDIAVFRPSNGTWYIQGSTSGLIITAFGQSGDIPNPADYDGDGKADISLFRPSSGNWHRINSSVNVGLTVAFGQNGDIPIPSFSIVQ